MKLLDFQAKKGSRILSAATLDYEVILSVSGKKELRDRRA